MKLDIADARSTKLLAVEAFRSQLGLIDDDPEGFELTKAQIASMTGRHEFFHKSK